jgi:phosphate acetyltransferase
LQVIKTAPGISIVSSCFLMEIPNKKYGDDGVMVFADCAININPNADELAAIAVATAETAKSLAGIDPRIAMLSFSTKGSAKHEFVDKVAQATAKVKEIAPQLNVDGELQADAALVESVGQLKSPGSPVAGKANVLVFPDLQAGNIGYKLVQRLAGADAVGPICQGLARPVNDLSRGCSVEDIVSVVAITAVQAQNMK